MSQAVIHDQLTLNLQAHLTPISANSYHQWLSDHGKARDIDAMHAEFLRLAGELGIDIAFQKDNAFRRNRHLVCFDMDSMLIEHEVTYELV